MFVWKNYRFNMAECLTALIHTYIRPGYIVRLFSFIKWFFELEFFFRFAI